MGKIELAAVSISDRETKREIAHSVCLAFIEFLAQTNSGFNEAHEHMIEYFEDPRPFDVCPSGKIFEEGVVVIGQQLVDSIEGNSFVITRKPGALD